MSKTFVVTILLFLSAVQARAEKWVVATLEWPPYTCTRCPKSGAGAKALRDALRTQGVEVEFVFSTWTKDIEDARRGKAVGFFPSWLETVASHGLERSVALFESPLGFVESRVKPLKWKKLEDLKGKTIGVAQDYGYTVEFNRLVRDGVIKTETVISDDTNIRKVAAGKIDGAIMDVNNALFFLNTGLSDLAGKVRVSPRDIKVKALYVAWGKGHKDKDLILRRALKEVNTQKIVDDYLRQYYPFCHSVGEEVTNPSTAR